MAANKSDTFSRICVSVIGLLILNRSALAVSLMVPLFVSEVVLFSLQLSIRNFFRPHNLLVTVNYH